MLPIYSKQHRWTFRGDHDVINTSLLLNGGMNCIIDELRAGCRAMCIHRPLKDCIRTITIELKTIVRGKVSILIRGTTNVDAIAVVLLSLRKRSIDHQRKIAIGLATRQQFPQKLVFVIL